MALPLWGTPGVAACSLTGTSGLFEDWPMALDDEAMRTLAVSAVVPSVSFVVVFIGV